MGTVTKPYTFSASTTASAAEVNANFDTIITEVNGLLDATNLANAAVTENKLADGAVTASKIGALAVTDAKVATGIDAAKIGAGTVSNTEFGYLDGVTSAIQAQIDSIVAGALAITGAASTVDTEDLTANRAVISNGSGKIAVSAVTSTELAYLDGVTSNVQTQLDAKLSTSAGAVGSSNLAANAVTESKISNAAVTSDKIANGTIVPADTAFMPDASSSGKIWFGKVLNTGPAITTGGAGMSGVSKLGTGHYRISFTSSFASSNDYSVVAVPDAASTTTEVIACSVVSATSYFDVYILGIQAGSNSARDHDFYYMLMF